MAPEEKKDASLAAVQNNTSSTSGDDRAFLENWSLSLGFFLLGILCGAAFGRLSGYAAFLWIVDLIIVLVYALWVYPSLFTNKPVLKSRGAVSFLNGLVGGIIFGAIWSSNLTKRHRGISHYVCVSLLGLAAIVFFCIFLMGYGGSNVATSTGPSSVPSKSSSAQNVNIDSSYVGTWKVEFFIPDATNPRDGLTANEAQMNDEIVIASNGNMVFKLDHGSGISNFDMYLKKADPDEGFYVVEKQTGETVGYILGFFDSQDSPPYILFSTSTKENPNASAWIFYRV